MARAQIAAGLQYIATEAGDLLVTEAGDYLVTENRAAVSPAFRATDVSTRRSLQSGGSQLDADGLAAVEEIFQAALDNGVTITSGWAFGSKLCSVSTSRTINLVAGQPDLVPQGTINASSVLSSGILGLRIDGADEGLKTEDGSGLFDDSTNYSVLLLSEFIGDTGEFGVVSPMILQQFTADAAGNIQLLGLQTGIQWIDRPDYSTNIDYGDTETAVSPLFMWWDFDSDGNQSLCHAGTRIKTTPQPFAGNPGDKALNLASYYQPGDVGFSVLIRFDGALSNAGRQDIFERVWAAYRKIVSAALIVGNSVTTGDWPRQFQQWGIYNNTLSARRAEGARLLQYFAPVGYVPPGTPDPSLSQFPVDDYDWFAPNVVINDEQQNMIANMYTWEQFLDCHNAIVDHFAPMNDQVRAIMCTQMAWPAYSDIPMTTPVDFAYVQSTRSNMLEASQAARAATATDFDNVPTSVCDVYALFNLGWDTVDDGNPPDPIDDLPNGDETLFTELPHPNQAGHDLMFAEYRDTFTTVIGL